MASVTSQHWLPIKDLLFVSVTSEHRLPKKDLLQSSVSSRVGNSHRLRDLCAAVWVLIGQSILVLRTTPRHKSQHNTTQIKPEDNGEKEKETRKEI